MVAVAKTSFNGYGESFAIVTAAPLIKTIRIQDNADFVCTKVSGTVFNEFNYSVLQYSNPAVTVFIRDMQSGRELMNTPMLWSQFFGNQSTQIQQKTAKAISKQNPLVFRAGAVIEITVQKLSAAVVDFPKATVGFLGTHFYLNAR